MNRNLILLPFLKIVSTVRAEFNMQDHLRRL